MQHPRFHFCAHFSNATFRCKPKNPEEPRLAAGRRISPIRSQNYHDYQRRLDSGISIMKSDTDVAVTTCLYAESTCCFLRLLNFGVWSSASRKGDCLVESSSEPPIKPSSSAPKGVRDSEVSACDIFPTDERRLVGSLRLAGRLLPREPLELRLLRESRRRGGGRKAASSCPRSSSALECLLLGMEAGLCRSMEGRMLSDVGSTGVTLSPMPRCSPTLSLERGVLDLSLCSRYLGLCDET
jgi:hypothetical protein